MIPIADVVYKPKIEGKPDIYPSKPAKIRWEELALLYGRRITVSGAAVDDNESTTIYVVPSGKLFLLLTATLTITNSDPSRRTSYAFITSPGASTSSVTRFIIASGNTTGEGTSTINPCIPILMLSGELVIIYNEKTDSTTAFSMIGYEIDANLFQNLY